MEREPFLDRLRLALQAAPPLATVHPPPPPPETVPRVTWRDQMRSTEARFAEALASVRARLVSEEDVADVLDELEVRTAVLTTDAIELPPTVEPLELDRVAEADAGVTRALAACAATGTLALEASPGEPRTVSLLPRVHVAAVDRGALLESPGELMRDLSRRYPGGLPSALTFVTGPSRSADIEGELILGVHGPLELVVVLV